LPFVDEHRKKTDLRTTQRWETLGRISARVADRLADTLAPVTRECEAARELLARESEAYWPLTSAIRASKQAEELVERLLMLGGARARNSGRRKLSTIVRDALQVARAVAPPTTFIRFGVADEPGAVAVDPCHVRQLVLALCLNAFEAMDEHGGVIEVSLEFPPAAGECASLARLSVKDPRGNVSRIHLNASRGVSLNPVRH
jgi:signal transduction histidine kinase